MTKHYHSFKAQPLQDWCRHAVALSRAKLRGIDQHVAANGAFPNSPSIALKAAVSPASTGGWGQQLGATVVGEFLQALQPRSAVAALFDRSFQVSLTGARMTSLPRRATAWPAPGWVMEGGSIPVQQGSFGFDPLGPMNKLAGISVLSLELSDATGEVAEQLIGDLMLDASGRALDTAVLSNTAADATRPAGLLVGVTALTPTAAGGAMLDRVLADVSKLLAAIAAGGGGAAVMLFAPLQQAMVIRAVTNLEVVTAPSLPAGMIIAVDVGAFAWAGDFPPEVSIGTNVALHMDDAATALSTAGSPPTVAAPIRSTFQTATYAIRLIHPVTWVKRSTTSAQYMTGVNW